MEHKTIKVAVVGAGTMGHGIALVFAKKGHQVALYDLSREILEGAFGRIRENLRVLSEARLFEPNETERLLARIRPITDLAEGLDGTSFVTEAIPENFEAKQVFFAEADRHCPPNVILASNTSTIKITEIARSTSHPERVVGTHWMIPPHIRPLVEVIKGEETAEETLSRTKALLEALGKTPIVVRKDSPGFLSNRMQAAIFSTALQMLSEGLATPEEIDKVWTSHLGLRYALEGPFSAMDEMGLDVVWGACQYLSKALDDPKMLPTKELKAKLEAKELGYKTGKGFYDYSKTPIQDVLAMKNAKLIELFRYLDIPMG